MSKSTRDPERSGIASGDVRSDPLLCSLDPLCEMSMEDPELGLLDGLWGNDAAQDALKQQPAPVAAPVQAPWSDPTWRYGKLRPGARAGGRDRPATDDDRVKFALAMVEDARYEGILAADRARIAEQAAADRALGLPSRAVEEDDRLRAVWETHERFANLDLGDDRQGPAGYFMNGVFPDRVTPAARRPALEALGDADKKLLIGKPTLETLEGATKTMGEDPDRRWESRLSDEKLDRIAPDGLSEADRETAALLVKFQRTGIGIDCEGYTREMTRQALPEATHTSGNAVFWKGAAGGSEDGLASPMRTDPKDGTQELDLQVGDVLQMHPSDPEQIRARRDERAKQEADGVPRDQQVSVPLPFKHIGMVLQVVEQGDEVIVRVGHSTPTQDQYNGDTFLGERPEGVRDDVYVYNKTEGRWHTARGAFSDRTVNEGTDRDFQAPLFTRFNRPQ